MCLRQTKIPSFQSWIAWQERNSMPDASAVGVYLLARFDGQPPAAVDPKDAQIIYIGETVHNSLSGRWRQFARSAFTRKSGHSGGWTFSQKYLGGEVGEVPGWLHVAAITVCMEEPEKGAYIRFLERLLIWEFVQQNGELPPCNSK